MNPRVTPAQHLLFDPRAADLLALLRDLQHIDARAIDAITTDLVRAQRMDAEVGYEELRRRLAEWLFEHENDMRPEQADLLRQEWGWLFN